MLLRRTAPRVWFDPRFDLIQCISPWGYPAQYLCMAGVVAHAETVDFREVVRCRRPFSALQGLYPALHPKRACRICSILQLASVVGRWPERALSVTKTCRSWQREKVIKQLPKGCPPQAPKTCHWRYRRAPKLSKSRPKDVARKLLQEPKVFPNSVDSGRLVPCFGNFAGQFV